MRLLDDCNSLRLVIKRSASCAGVSPTGPDGDSSWSIRRAGSARQAARAFTALETLQQQPDLLGRAWVRLARIYAEMEQRNSEQSSTDQKDIWNDGDKRFESDSRFPSHLVGVPRQARTAFTRIVDVHLAARLRRTIDAAGGEDMVLDRLSDALPEITDAASINEWRRQLASVEERLNMLPDGHWQFAELRQQATGSTCGLGRVPSNPRNVVGQRRSVSWPGPTRAMRPQSPN